MRLNGRLARTYTAAALVSSLLVLPAAAAQPASRIQINNFGRISQSYYRGAQPHGRDYRDLAAIGVKSVIDLTQDGDRREPAEVQRAGMRFYRIPMTTHETPSAAKVSQFLQLVSDPANQPVYVHCQGGRHRTGVLTAVYRMTREGWSPDRAFAEMKQYKYGADFLHPEFKAFVYEYGADLAHAAATTATAKAGG